jgi:glycosyltransferase involved in cell wall biosynthesis
MKILHLLCFPLFGSGSGTYVRKLTEKLASEFSEDKIAILCPDKVRSVKGVKIIPLKLPFPVAFTGHPDWPNCKIYSELTSKEMIELIESMRVQVIKAVEEFKPDVIHVHHASVFAAIASYVRAIYHINYLVTIHGTGVLCASQDKRWVPIVRPGLFDAFLINAVSGDTKKWMIKVFSGKLNRKTKIITGGVDLEAFPKDGPTDIVDKKYNLYDKKVVIFAGKLTEKKGVEYLIKAAPKINAVIFIIGGGDIKEKLEDLAKKLKVKNVIFTGYKGKESIEEFRQFYRRANAFVFPSVWDEPLGLVALEAMASSTPVVASKKGGIPLAVKNGYNGFLVRARSAKEIAKAVNKILNNPELEKKLAENARKTVEEKFNWTIIAKKFHEWYDFAYQNSMKRSKTKGLTDDKTLIEREKSEIKGNKLDYI